MSKPVPRLLSRSHHSLLKSSGPSPSSTNVNTKTCCWDVYCQQHNLTGRRPCDGATCLFSLSSSLSYFPFLSFPLALSPSLHHGNKGLFQQNSFPEPRFLIFFSPPSPSPRKDWGRPGQICRWGGKVGQLTLKDEGKLIQILDMHQASPDQAGMHCESLSIQESTHHALLDMG